MKNKKIVIMIITCFLLILLIFGVIIYFVFLNPEIDPQNYVQIMDDQTKINTNPKLLDSRYVDGLEITNLSLIERDNITQLKGIITNKTSGETEEQVIKITLVDQNNEELTSIEAYIKNLQPGESTSLYVTTTFDYTNAYDIKFTK